MENDFSIVTKAKPSKLFSENKFRELLNYADESKELILKYLSIQKQDVLQNILSYTMSQLDYFGNSIESDLKQYSLFRLGALLGVVESCGAINYEQQQEQLSNYRVFSEGHTIKYLDEIIGLLEIHGILTHSDLCEHLSVKASTLTEAMKKVLATETIRIRLSGKYKLYSLTDIGISYGRSLRKRKDKPTKQSNVFEGLKRITESITDPIELQEFVRNVLDILHIDAPLKNGDILSLHFDSPRLIGNKEFEIESVEKNITNKVEVYGHYRDVREKSTKINIDDWDLEEIKTQRKAIGY